MSNRFEEILAEDKEAFSLLCKCGKVYVVHGEAKNRQHIVCCSCGVFQIDPNYDPEHGLYIPYLKMLATH